MAQGKAPKSKKPPEIARLWVTYLTDYNNPLRITNMMELYSENHCISLMITGRNLACEQLISDWCHKSEILYHGLTAGCSKDGDEAIQKRNKLNLDQEKPDALIAFVGGKEFNSTVRVATAKGIPV